MNNLYAVRQWSVDEPLPPAPPALVVGDHSIPLDPDIEAALTRNYEYMREQISQRAKFLPYRYTSFTAYVNDLLRDVLAPTMLIDGGAE